MAKVKTKPPNSKVKEVQQKLKDEGYDVKVDGFWGPQTEGAYTVYLKKLKADHKDTKESEIFRDIMKNLSVPLNVRQFTYDLFGGEETLTEKDLKSSELSELRKIVRSSLKKGKNTIEYKDYNEKQDVQKASNTSLSTLTSSATSDNYNLRTTLGQANIIPVGKDTFVIDSYNFNDVPEGRDSFNFGEKVKNVFLKPSVGGGSSGQAYSLSRSVGKWFGSGEGDGSSVIINTAEVDPKDLGPVNRNEIMRDNTNVDIKIPIQKRNFGGLIKDILPTAAGLINPALGIGVGAAMQLLPEMQETLSPDITYNTTPYGNMKYGGYMKGKYNPTGFKQYSAKSHDNGGMAVDSSGDPTIIAPVAEIQNKENVFNNYVYSDTLKNPQTGRTFNVDMKKIIKKYNNADTDLVNKNSVKIKAANLAKINDNVRLDTSLSPYGGTGSKSSSADKLYEKQGGGPIVPGVDDPFIGMNSDLPIMGDPFQGMMDVANSNNNLYAFPETDPYTKAPLAAIKPVQSFLVGENPLDNRSSSGADASPTMTQDNLTGTRDRNFNFNIPAVIAKGIGLADSFIRAVRPAEVEQPVLPNYQTARGMFNRATQDYTAAGQEAQGASNLLAQTNRASSSGFSQFRNREAARIAGLQDTLADIKIKERGANAQLDMQRGGFEARVAEDTANRIYQTNVDNLQNRAAKDLFGQAAFSDLANVGTEFSKYQAFRETLQNRKDIAQMTTNELVALAKAQGLNFSLGEAEEFLQAIKTGQNPIRYTK